MQFGGTTPVKLPGREVAILTEGFKSGLIGFRKQDVLQYIDKLSADYAQMISDRDEEIRLLREQNKELKQKLKNLRSLKKEGTKSKL